MANIIYLGRKEGYSFPLREKEFLAKYPGKTVSDYYKYGFARHHAALYRAFRPEHQSYEDWEQLIVDRVLDGSIEYGIQGMSMHKSMSEFLKANGLDQ